MPVQPYVVREAQVARQHRRGRVISLEDDSSIESGTLSLRRSVCTRASSCSASRPCLRQASQWLRVRSRSTLRSGGFAVTGLPLAGGRAVAAVILRPLRVRRYKVLTIARSSSKTCDNSTNGKSTAGLLGSRRSRTSRAANSKRAAIAAGPGPPATGRWRGELAVSSQE